MNNLNNSIFNDNIFNVTNLNLFRTTEKISNLNRIKNINNSRNINGPENIDNDKEMKM